MRKILLMASTLVLLPAVADTEDLPGTLAKLQKMRIVIDLEGSAAEAEGLTEETLRDEVTVLLRTKLPRLALTQQRGHPWLDALVHIEKLSAERGYFGHYEVQIYRWAIIQETQQGASVVVWQKGGILTGPPRAARGHIREFLDRALTSFAADWYRDNP